MQRKAANTYKADVAETFDGAALRAALESHVGAPVHGTTRRARVCDRRDALADRRCRERRGAGCGDPLCRVGAAHAGRPRGAQGRRAVPRAAQARLSEAGSAGGRYLCRRFGMETSGRPCVAPARGLCADRPGHGSRRRTRPGALLHLVSRAGQGLVRARPAGEKARGRGSPVQEVAVQRDARRLSARGAHLGIPQAARRRLARGCAGDDVHRQSDGRGDGAPDLQRLHEVVHLPEAGPGRHPAIRNARAEGRAGAALGIRDLFAADPVEPPQPAPSRSRCRVRQARAHRRHGSRGIHARASPRQ